MCIFCEIIAGNIPSAKVYEDELVYAFRDINPQAPVHVLVVPKQHIPSADAINADNAAVVASIFAAIASRIGVLSLAKPDGSESFIAAPRLASKSRLSLKSFLLNSPEVPHKKHTGYSSPFE